MLSFWIGALLSLLIGAMLSFFIEAMLLIFSRVLLYIFPRALFESDQPSPPGAPHRFLPAMNAKFLQNALRIIANGAVR